MIGTPKMEQWLSQDFMSIDKSTREVISERVNEDNNLSVSYDTEESSNIFISEADGCLEITIYSIVDDEEVEQDYYYPYTLAGIQQAEQELDLKHKIIDYQAI